MTSFLFPIGLSNLSKDAVRALAMATFANQHLSTCMKDIWATGRPVSLDGRNGTCIDPVYEHVFDEAEHWEDKELFFERLEKLRAVLLELFDSWADVLLFLDRVQGRVTDSDLARSSGMHPGTWGRRYRRMIDSLRHDDALRRLAVEFGVSPDSAQYGTDT